MWFLVYPLVAAAGGALWELVLRPAPKDEVVQYDADASLVDANEVALKNKGIDCDIFTNGAYHWIMVKKADRANAVAVISDSTRQWVATKNRIPT